MSSPTSPPSGAWPTSGPVPGWYADPWRAAPWRWWDGYRWTPHLSGYAYPIPHVAPPREFAAKGPGIKGGGIAAIGAGAGLVGSIAVAVVFFAEDSGHLDGRNPWYMLVSQLVLWAGFLGAVVVASGRNGTGSLARDYGLSWPKWRDLTTGVAGGVLGRLPSTLILVLVVIATNGFNTPSAAGRQIDGTTPEGRAGWVILGLFLVVGAPFVEELLFRGLIQGAFTRRLGATPAIYVTALHLLLRPHPERRSLRAVDPVPHRAHPGVPAPTVRQARARDDRPLHVQRHRLRSPAGAGLPLN